MDINPVTPRTLPAGRGASWLAEGYGLFKQAPALWLAVAVLWLCVTIAAQRLGSLASLAMNLLLPVFVGGLMLGCKAQSENQPFKLDFLGAGFARPQFGSLVTLGVVGLLAMLAVGLAVVAAVGASVAGALASGAGLESIEVGASALLALLVLLILLVPLSMALWFAPALVMLQGLEPIAALKASYRGCIANIAAMFVNGLLVILIAIVATIPFALGWLVALPVLIASVYFGYRDIFVGVSGQGELI